MSKTSVSSLIKEARQWCEDYAVDSPFSADLSCMCAIASSYLSNRFHQYGINHQIAIYDTPDFGHCFIIYDGHIIDITATQFDSSTKKFKPIEIVKLNTVDLEKFPFWEPTHLFCNAEQLLTFQLESGWSQEHTVLQVEKPKKKYKR